MKRLVSFEHLARLTVGLTLVVGGCESRSNAKTEHSEVEGRSGEKSGGSGAGHASEESGSHEGGPPKGGSHKKGGGSSRGAGGDAGEHEAGERTVELTKKAEERFGVETQKAEAGSLADRVTAPAKVEHDPSQKQKVSPLVSGRVSNLNVTVGDRVEQGQQLAVLRSIELGEARAEVEQAKSDLKIAKADFERVKELKAEGIASERRFLEAKQKLQTARADLSAARSTLQTYGVGGGQGPFYGLSSEIDGRVIEQFGSDGEVKGPNEPLFLLADNSPIWVIGDVYERDIANVEKGMTATVTLEAYPARTWRGTVDWVADTVDPETRNMAVRVELPNEDGAIRPGMFGAVHLEAKQSEKHALVPVGSVQKAHGETVVFVPGDKPRHYRAQSVETGAEAKGLVEIRSGLAPGDVYVTRGAFDLKATLTAASRSGGHHH